MHVSRATSLGVRDRDEHDNGAGLVLLGADDGFVESERQLLPHSCLELERACLRVSAGTVNVDLGG